MPTTRRIIIGLTLACHLSMVLGSTPSLSEPAGGTAPLGGGPCAPEPPSTWRTPLLCAGAAIIGGVLGAIPGAIAACAAATAAAMGTSKAQADPLNDCIPPAAGAGSGVSAPGASPGAIAPAPSSP